MSPDRFVWKPRVAVAPVVSGGCTAGLGRSGNMISWKRETRGDRRPGL